jgi:hypothetical protein
MGIGKKKHIPMAVKKFVSDKCRLLPVQLFCSVSELEQL